MHDDRAPRQPGARTGVLVRISPHCMMRQRGYGVQVKKKTLRERRMPCNPQRGHVGTGLALIRSDRIGGVTHVPRGLSDRGLSHPDIGGDWAVDPGCCPHESQPGGLSESRHAGGWVKGCRQIRCGEDNHFPLPRVSWLSEESVLLNCSVCIPSICWFPGMDKGPPVGRGLRMGSCPLGPDR